MVASEEEAVVWAGQAELGFSPSRRALVERSDGSILVSGRANFKSTQGFFLLAVSRRGEALWQRLIGGSQLLHEALAMRSLSDGSTVVLARVVDRSSRGGWIMV